MSDFQCKECGSQDVEVKVWLNLNSGRWQVDAKTGDECWCCKCEEHSHLEPVKEEASR